MQKIFSPGIWGMLTGAANNSGSVDEMDTTYVWNLQTGKSGYWNSDLKMDSQSNNMEKNDIWMPNLGESSQLLD